MRDTSPSNTSGKVLEAFVSGTVLRWFSLQPTPHPKWLKDGCTRPALVTNVPFVTLYGTIGRSEFGLYLPDGDIRIECKWQSVSGSVDEKFPYLLECVKGMHEPTVVIVVDGGGAKPAAIEWLKKSAAAIQTKRILVVSISEFGTWMRNLKKGG